MKNKLIVLILTIFILPYYSNSQNDRKYTVKGKILDEQTKAPLDYASIQLFLKDSLVNGTLSDINGNFAVEAPTGQYTIRVDFMGYTPYTSAEFQLARESGSKDLGTVYLKTIVSELGEVVVEAEQSSMQLALDRKIFNVGKDLANAGGSASDILTNIPSVSVDPEGGVKLRGSDNVRILIDGKPSGLVSIKGGSGLQQLQANMVERVEIITNPSARYEAEGMAGIINIILKKDKSQGFNGSFDIITGYPTNLGVAANFNYRHKKFNFFINYGVSYRKQPNLGNLTQRLFDGDTTFILKQTTNGEITGFNYNARGGLDYFLTEKDVFTVSYLNRRMFNNRVTKFRYEDYVNNLNTLKQSSTRRQDEDEIEPNSEYSLIYKKTYSKKGHELIGEIKYIDYWENSDQLYTQSFFTAAGVQDPTRNLVQTSVNDEFEKQWLFQLDYIQPFSKDGKLETGIRTSFRDMINDFIVNTKNADGTLSPLPGLDNVFDYNENIHAAYGIFGNKHKALSYQLGLRAEWTDVRTTLRETQQVNPREYINLFPSAHFTFSLPKDHGLQLSYSRRVRRPFYNDLSPYSTFSDARNFFSGNPDLNPEFTDLFEIGHLKFFNKGSLSSSIYYRNTIGKIDRIRTVDNTGFSTTRPENLLSENAMGFEFASGYNPYNWWKIDLNLNLFYAEIDGSNIIEDYKRNTYSWFTRQTSRFMLPKNLDLQLRANYEAPQKTAQGRRKSLYYTDFSISKDIIKGNGTITLNILDVFNTRKNRSIFEGPNFYTESTSQFRRRQTNLTFSYRIKQTKSTRPKREEE